MSIHNAPFKNPNYILLNQREHNRMNPNKQQGLNQIADGYCQVCGRDTHYMNQQLCYICRNHLIRGNLFGQYGEIIIRDDEWKKFYPKVSDYIVNKINFIMDGKFKTRCYRSKTAKMLWVMDEFLKAKGEIEPDVAYRRLRYYADTSKRDSLQMTLQKGKKIFDFLFRIVFK